MSAVQAVRRIVSSCAESGFMAVVVVYANAVISGGAALASTAGRLVTLPGTATRPRAGVLHSY